MTRILFILILLFLSSCAVGPDPTIREPKVTYNLYFPDLYLNRTDHLGLQPSDNGLLNVDRFKRLSDYGPEKIRINFGSSSNPNDTPYQYFLSGGWSAVDLEVLPDLDKIAELGVPVIVTMTLGGSCTFPNLTARNAYADFVADFSDRYGVDYIEVWNEPDLSGGSASLFGCFGSNRANELKAMVVRVKDGVQSEVQVGVSFAIGSQANFNMLVAVMPVLDWVGVHHYSIWTGAVSETYPGSVQTLVSQVRAIAGTAPVFVTEVNLRNPLETCSDPVFVQAQINYIRSSLQSSADLVIPFAFVSWSDWQCTGLYNSPAESSLLPVFWSD